MSPLYLAAAYAAGAATTYGVLYVRMRLRARRAKRRAAAVLDAFMSSLRVTVEDDEEQPPCDDPSCPACAPRRKREAEQKWSEN